MRGEVQSYLELSLDYRNCGLWDEAIDVLSRIVDREATRFPLVYYYLGYFWQNKGKQEKAIQYYELAGQMPPDYCFPFRWESRDVLEQALLNNPVDSRAPYYMGNLLYDHQPEKAIIHWENSRQRDDSFSITHRNLGLAYARNENNLEKAIVSLEKAVASNNTDARLYFELDKLYETASVSPQKRLTLLDQNHDVVKKYDDALTREIRLYVQLGHYDQAINLLQDHTFHIWEGGGSIHDVYVDAHLLRGKQRYKEKKYQDALKDFEAALEYPDNLQVGRPGHGGRAAQIYYFIGTTYESLEQKEKAWEYYKKSITARHGWSEIRFYQGLALKKLERKEEADKIFDGLIDFAQKKLETAESMDFFAKFGEKKSEMIRKANTHYLLGLGYLGKDQSEQAKAEFEKVMQLNLNHIGAKDQLSEL
jgi:tetratricopeptide (TPR) repeat protein